MRRFPPRLSLPIAKAGIYCQSHNGEGATYSLYSPDMAPREIDIGSWRIKLPASRIARISIGVALILAGVLGFLPVLGFWMIPLGLMVISYDIAVARKARRKLTVWWHRTNGQLAAKERNGQRRTGQERAEKEPGEN